MWVPKRSRKKRLETICRHKNTQFPVATKNHKGQYIWDDSGPAGEIYKDILSEADYQIFLSPQTLLLKYTVYNRQTTSTKTLLCVIVGQ